MNLLFQSIFRKSILKLFWFLSVSLCSISFFFVSFCFVSLIVISLQLLERVLGSVYTGPVGTVPYGTDRKCLELFPLYRVYTGSVPKTSYGFVKS